MKLTKQMREDFVAKVMKDTPDRSGELLQQLEAAAYAVVKRNVPEPVWAMWSDPALRGYINTTWHRVNIGYPGKSVVIPHAYGTPIPDSAWQDETYKKAQQAYLQHEEDRDALRAKVYGLIGSFSTIKAAREGLPEFEKYLPIESAKQAYAVAVVVSGVVDSLTQAGWPAEKQAA